MDDEDNPGQPEQGQPTFETNLTMEEMEVVSSEDGSANTPSQTDGIDSMPSGVAAEPDTVAVLMPVEVEVDKETKGEAENDEERVEPVDKEEGGITENIQEDKAAAEGVIELQSEYNVEVADPEVQNVPDEVEEKHLEPDSSVERKHEVEECSAIAEGVKTDADISGVDSDSMLETIQRSVEVDEKECESPEQLVTSVSHANEEKGEITPVQEVGQTEAVAVEQEKNYEDVLQEVAVTVSEDNIIQDVLPDSSETSKQDDITVAENGNDVQESMEVVEATNADSSTSGNVVSDSNAGGDEKKQPEVVNDENGEELANRVLNESKSMPAEPVVYIEDISNDTVEAESEAAQGHDSGMLVGQEANVVVQPKSDATHPEPAQAAADPTLTMHVMEDGTVIQDSSNEMHGKGDENAGTMQELREPESVQETMIVPSPVASPSKRLRMPDHNYEKNEDSSPEASVLAAQQTEAQPQPVEEPAIAKQTAFICGKAETLPPKAEQEPVDSGILPEVSQYSHYPTLMQNIAAPEGVIPEEIFDRNEDKSKSDGQVVYQDVHNAQVYGNQLVTSDGQILTVVNSGQDESVEAIQAFIHEGNEWNFDHQVIQMTNQHGVHGDAIAVQDSIQGPGFYVPAELLQGTTEQAVSLFEVRMADGSTQYLQIPVTIPVQKQTPPPAEPLPVSLPSTTERQASPRTQIERPKPVPPPAQRQATEVKRHAQRHFTQDPPERQFVEESAAVQRHFTEDSASLSQLVSSSMEAVDFGSDAGGSYILSHAQHVLNQCVEEKPKVMQVEEPPRVDTEAKEPDDDQSLLAKQKKQTLEERVSRLLKGKPGSEAASNDSEQNRQETPVLSFTPRSESRLSSGGQNSPAANSPVPVKEVRARESSSAVTFPKALMKNMFTESKRFLVQETKKSMTKVIDGKVIHNYRCGLKDVRQMSSKKIDLNPSLEAFSIDVISKKPSVKTAQAPRVLQEAEPTRVEEGNRISLPSSPEIDLPGPKMFQPKPRPRVEPVRHVLKITPATREEKPKRPVLTKIIGGQVIHNIGCDPSDPRMFSMKKVDLPPCLETFSLDEPPPPPRKRQQVAIPSRRVFPSNPPEKKIMHTRLTCLPPGCIDLIEEQRIDSVQMKLPFEQDDDLDLDINLFEPLSATAVPLMRRMLQNQEIKQEEKPKPIFASNRLLTPVAVKMEKKYIYTDDSGKQYEIPAGRNVHCFDATRKVNQYVSAKKEPEYVLPETSQYFEEQPESVVEEGLVLAPYQNQQQTEDYYYTEDGSLVVNQPQGQPEGYIGEDGLYYYQNEQYFFTPETLGLAQESGQGAEQVVEAVGEQGQQDEQLEYKAAYFPQSDILDLDSIQKQNEAEVNDEEEFVIVQPRTQNTPAKIVPPTPRAMLKPQTYSRIKSEYKSPNVPSPLHILKSKKSSVLRRSLPETKSVTYTVKQSVPSPEKRISVPFRNERCYSPETEDRKPVINESGTQPKVFQRINSNQQLLANPVKANPVVAKTAVMTPSGVKTDTAAVSGKNTNIVASRGINLPPPQPKCISLPPPVAKGSPVKALPPKSVSLPSPPVKSINLPVTGKGINTPVSKSSSLPVKSIDLPPSPVKSASLAPSGVKVTGKSEAGSDSKQVKIRIVSASAAGATTATSAAAPVSAKPVPKVTEIMASPSTGEAKPVAGGKVPQVVADKEHTAQAPSTSPAVKPATLAVEETNEQSSVAGVSERSKTAEQPTSEPQSTPTESTLNPDADLGSPPILSPEKPGQAVSSNPALPTSEADDVATVEGDDDLPPVLEPVNPDVKPILDEWDSEDEKPLKPKRPILTKTYDRRKLGETEGSTSVPPAGNPPDAVTASPEKPQTGAAKPRLVVIPKKSPGEVKITPKPALKSPPPGGAEVPIVSVSPGPGAKQVRFATSPVKPVKDSTPIPAVPTPKKPAVKPAEPGKRRSDSNNTPEKVDGGTNNSAVVNKVKVKSEDSSKTDEKAATPSKTEKPVSKLGEKTPTRMASDKTPVKAGGEKTPGKVTGEKVMAKVVGQKPTGNSVGEKPTAKVASGKPVGKAPGEKPLVKTPIEKIPSKAVGEKTPLKTAGEKMPLKASGEKTPLKATGEKTPGKPGDANSVEKPKERITPSRKRTASPVEIESAKKARPAPRKSAENGRKLSSPEGRNLRSPEGRKINIKSPTLDSPSKIKEFDIFSTPTMKHKRVSFSDTEEIISLQEVKASPPKEKRASRSRDSKGILKPKTHGKRPSDGVSEQPERKRRKAKGVTPQAEVESDEEDFLSGADMGAVSDRLPGVASKPCPICSVRYTTAEGLANHIATHNGFINNKKICPLCTYSVLESKRSKAQIQSHILTAHRILLPDSDGGSSKSGKSSD